MKNIIKKIIVFCLITLSSLNSFSQPSIEDEITGNLESPDAPIGDFIIPMLLVGVVIGYRLLKQKKQLAK
jgi:hypothetical protein